MIFTANINLTNSHIIRIIFTLCILFSIPLHAASEEIYPDSLLTPAEKRWLSENKNTLCFSTDPSWPPSIYIEDGQLKGFITNYLKIIEDELNVEFQWISYNTWPEVIEALINKEIDFIPGIHTTEDRQRHFLFSESVGKIELGIFLNENSKGKLNGLENLTLVGVNEYASNEYIKNIYPETALIYADDYSEAILEAAYGLADGVVIDFITADFLFKKYGISNLVYGEKLNFNWDIRFAVRKDMPELHGIINKVLKSIPEEQKKEIYTSWIDNELQLPGFFEAHFKTFILSASGIAVLLFTIILFIISLRRQVRKKTRALEKARNIARDNEEKYRMIVENTTDVVWLADLDLNTYYVSPAVEKMFGWSADDYLRLEIKDRHPEYIIKEIKAILKEELENEKDPASDKSRSRYFEIEHFRKNGELLWIILNVTFLRDNKGKPVGIHGIARDFTDHRKMNEYIKNRLSLEKMLTQLSKKAIKNVNPDNIFRYILKKAGVSLQLSHSYFYKYDAHTQTFHNSNYWCRKCEKDSPEPPHIQLQFNSEWLKENLESGRILKYKTCERIPDKNLREIFLNNKIQSLLIVPLFLRNEFLGFIGFDDSQKTRNWQKEDIKVLQLLAYIVTSLLERIDREKELMIKDRSIELSTIGVAFTNLDGYVSYANPTFLKYWRYNSPEDVLNRNVRDLWASEKELNNILQALQTKGRWKGEMVAKRSDGTSFIAEVDSNTLKDKNGKPICWQASFIDITDRKNWENDLIKAKEKAEESNRLKTAFLANMSHEIRTPMNGIMGFLNLIKDVNLSFEEQHEYIELVNKNGKRLLDTVTDIIEIAKIEAGETEIVEKETGLNVLLSLIFNNFKQEANEKGVALYLDNKRSLHDLHFRTDSVKVECILTNLIKNAIKFTERGTIHFSADLKDDHLVFYVKDTGVGIPYEHQEAIFNRFIQADMSYSRKHEGSGLGLSISKAYAELLGGQLWVDSTPGRGSTFWLSLPFIPVQNASEAEDAPGVADRAGKSLAGLKILVAEDDYISFKFLETVLIDYGINVLHATSGDAAVSMMTTISDIAMVLMDIKMPGLNGVEATRKIRALNIKTPIVAQTALAVLHEKRKALEAGCDDYITKPINKDVLMEKIRKYCLTY